MLKSCPFLEAFIVLCHILLPAWQRLLSRAVEQCPSKYRLCPKIHAAKHALTFPRLSCHSLTFTPLTAARQSLLANLVKCNSWIREPPDLRWADIFSRPGFLMNRPVGSWRQRGGSGKVCRSDSWTHSMLQRDGGSCHGDRSGQASTSVVLVFGCPSDMLVQKA